MFGECGGSLVELLWEVCEFCLEGASVWGKKSVWVQIFACKDNEKVIVPHYFWPFPLSFSGSGSNFGIKEEMYFIKSSQINLKKVKRYDTFFAVQQLGNQMTRIYLEMRGGAETGMQMHLI